MSTLAQYWNDRQGKLERAGSAAAAARGRFRRAAVVLTVCLGVGVWAWSAGLDGPYHFDDYLTPLGDPASQSLAAWREHLAVTLRPVTKLTYALEADAGIADTPAPRRVVSLALHAIEAALLFVLVARLCPSAAPFVAAFLAVIWFLHPVHADAVLLLSGRTAVVSGVFLLAALLALDRAQAWLSALLFALACLSRETALAGLLPLLIVAVSRPGATRQSVLRECLPVLVAGVAVLCWIVATPRYRALAEYSFAGRPFWSSVVMQVGAVPVGLGLTFEPARLSIDYGIALPTRFTQPLFLLGISLYAAAAAGVWFCLRRSRAAAVGLALWLVALLPTQSVVPKLDALSNRPLSLALAGLLLAATPALAAGFARLRPGFPRFAVFCSAAIVLVALAGATTQRAELFQTDLQLWHDAAAKSRTNARPHVQYAVLLKRAGRDREARAAIAAAQAIDPFDSQIATFSRIFRDEEGSP